MCIHIYVQSLNSVVCCRPSTAQVSRKEIQQADPIDPVFPPPRNMPELHSFILVLIRIMRWEMHFSSYRFVKDFLPHCLPPLSFYSWFVLFVRGLQCPGETAFCKMPWWKIAKCPGETSCCKRSKKKAEIPLEREGVSGEVSRRCNQDRGHACFHRARGPTWLHGREGSCFSDQIMLEKWIYFLPGSEVAIKVSDDFRL